MQPPRTLIVFLIILSSSLQFPTFIRAQFCMNDLGNYTTNSTYRTNLNSLFSSLTSNTSFTSGFHNLSAGKTSGDTVNVISLCRGDISPEDCRGCTTNSTRQILEHCPNQKEAIGFYETCSLRFSNRSIAGVMETQPTVHMANDENVTDVNQFNPSLQTLLSRLRSRAAAGNSTRKFATGNESAGFETIYGLVQCSPDITEQDCNDCVVAAVRDIPFCCAGKLGARVLKPSCSFRYENYRFYQPTPDESQSVQPVTPAPATSPSNLKGGNNKRTIIIFTVSIASVLLALVIFIIVYLRVERTSKKIRTIDEISSVESLHLDFETIKVSTDGFLEQNKLGEGGFGSVYKGRLGDGQCIAVKRLSSNSKQGDVEFKNEVLVMAKLHHRNLVKLIGFCLQRNERLLIYEYVPNGSLDQFLFDRTKSVDLDWETRSKIIGGIAKGLLYLHEDSRHPIIHRDLKASNVLLDAEMNPKISDFGLARLFILDQTHSNTSKVVGTYGYMAPEYAMHEQFSFKSDVFSFGVLILEIVSGRRNSCFNEEDLLSDAWKNWQAGTASNIIDPNLRNGSVSEMIRCIHIGLLCVQETMAERPSMASILFMLSSYSSSLPLPSKPSIFIHSTTESTMSFSSPYSRQNNNYGVEDNVTEAFTPISRNELTVSEMYPR